MKPAKGETVSMEKHVFFFGDVMWGVKVGGTIISACFFFLCVSDWEMGTFFMLRSFGIICLTPRRWVVDEG